MLNKNIVFSDLSSHGHRQMSAVGSASCFLDVRSFVKELTYGVGHLVLLSTLFTFADRYFGTFSLGYFLFALFSGSFDDNYQICIYLAFLFNYCVQFKRSIFLIMQLDVIGYCSQLSNICVVLI